MLKVLVKQQQQQNKRSELIAVDILKYSNRATTTTTTVEVKLKYKVFNEFYDMSV